MANESSKSAVRRGFDRRFATRWFVGDGIDIGAGDDPLNKMMPLFPLIRSVRPWDIQDGDAMFMEGVDDNQFDFVHSSHCLEHINDPFAAFENWIRICRIGGHLLITIPDEDLYEQGVFPSRFNADHKHSFTINKAISWSNNSVNLFDILKRTAINTKVLKIELLDSGFFYGRAPEDQSLGFMSESAIEVILQKTN